MVCALTCFMMISDMSEKVALLQDINSAADEIFEASGLEVIRFPKTISEDNLVDLAHDVRILGVRSGPALSKDVFQVGECLQVVGCYCSGTSHVATQTAAEAGIPVFNSADNARSVAEYVVGATFNLMRRLHEHSGSLHDGRWTKTSERSHEVAGKTVGIIGYGEVGSLAGLLLENVGMHVRYYDLLPREPREGTNAQPVATLEELLTTCDVISIHVSGEQMILTEERINQMKPGSYLINAARGQVVDQSAVARAVEDGHLAGYAADVFVDEPKAKGNRFNNPFKLLKNVLLTPHIGGSTIEAEIRVARETSKRLLGYLATGNTVGAVNVGNVDLGPLKPGTSRVLQYHSHEPGAALALDQVFANYGHNIEDQRVAPRGTVGYVVTDVSPPIDVWAKSDIARLDQTLYVKVIES